jgi:cell wall-associated NlpC family hydrolase
MHKGEVVRSVLLGSMLFMTACSQHTPKVEKQVNYEVKGKQNVNSIVEHQKEENILTIATLSAPQENWVPLKIEDEIEWNAKELLGRKYVWGATGPINYDCSGFTQKIYGDLGIKIPRVSRHQAEQGELVYFDELQKGDLVFFATNKRKPNRVTHVGIYLGNGNFIHASSGAKKVVICNFNKHCFYKKKFLWGRRVIQDKHHYASTANAESFESAI